MLRYVIIISAFVFIGHRLIFNDGVRESFNLAAKLFAGGEFAALIIMMLVNWGIEAYKWKYIVRQSEDISFYRAFLGVCAGVTTSIFMPFRTGEFVGKIFILRKTKPLKALLMSAVGSTAQLTVTLFFGVFSFLILFFLTDMLPDYISQNVYLSMVCVFSVLLAVLMFLFFNLRRIARYVYRYSLSRNRTKIAVYVRVVMRYSDKELLLILLMSAMRYIVFTSQYVLLLLFFGIELNFMIIFLLVSLIYLLMAFIPSVAFAEIAIRGSVAVALILPILSTAGVYFVGADSNIIVAATMLWVINLAVPALIGVVGVSRLRFLRGGEA